MIDGELAATLEQTGKCALTIWSFEDIGLLNLNPRQLAALFSEFVEFVRNVLLFGEQCLARGKPFLARDDFRWREGACCHNQNSADRVLNIGRDGRFLA